MSQNDTTRRQTEFWPVALTVAFMSPIPVAAFMLHSAACTQYKRDVDSMVRHHDPQADEYRSGFSYRYAQIASWPDRMIFEKGNGR